MDHTYYVKPIANRPNICSAVIKLKTDGATIAFMKDRLLKNGHVELTEDQAREWQYCSASGGGLRSVVQD